MEEEEEEERPAKEATMPKLRREDKKDEDEKQEPSLGVRFNRDEEEERIYTRSSSVGVFLCRLKGLSFCVLKEFYKGF